MITLTAIVWYITGVWGFIFWYTKDFNLTTREIPLAIFEGLLGPLTWLVGAGIHGSSKTIIKKRDNNGKRT